MTRNPNPTWIQDNNESRSTTRNPSLTMIHDVAWNPTLKRIQDAVRNPYPIRLKTLLLIMEVHSHGHVFKR